MEILNSFLIFLKEASFLEIAGLIFLINISQIVFVAVFGDWLIKRFAHRTVSASPYQLTNTELGLALITILLNTFITIVGYKLWQTGIIIITNGSLSTMLLDMVVFVLFIDLSMYLLHRVAHWDKIFPYLHSTHHIYENPRPITLFVLNPLETLSFGTLWLAILIVYPASWAGIFLFLTFNLLFGMMGHLGVEPLADNLFTKYFIKVFSTSTFHAMHHKTDRYNFGFYLIFWDKLLNTLHPAYYNSFKSR